MNLKAFSVRKEFIKWKALYFSLFASQGPYLYFLVNFYLSRGINHETAGYIESIVPFIGCIFRPLACYIADRFALHRLLLSSSMLIYAISLLGLCLLALFVPTVSVHQVSLPSESLDNGSTTVGAIPGNNTVAANTSLVMNNAGPDQYYKFIVPMLVILRFLSTIGFSPATSLLDGIVYHGLEVHEEGASWGRQRAYGSLGFSLVALLSAFLLDEIEGTNYAIGFFLALISAVIFIVISICSVENYHNSVITSASVDEGNEDGSELMFTKDKPEKKESHLFQVLRFIFSDGHVFLCMGVATAVGCFSAVRDIYVSEYLEYINQGKIKKIMGVMQIIVGLLEIPTMFATKWLFRRIGTLPFFATCFAAFALRFWFYTLLTKETIWCFLLIELLHLFCFALVVPAFTFHAHRRVVKYQAELPVVTTIMQGLISSLYLGLGFGLGSIFGGVFTERLGHIWCMLSFSIMAAGCFFIFTITWLAMVLFSRKKVKEKSKAEDMDTKIHNQLEQNHDL